MTVPPPPAAGQQPAARLSPASGASRRYDLDGLRAWAMFLGVVLHAAVPFVPYWDEEDAGGTVLWGLFEYIHTWRMPLFFLLSGYFTAMLWRRRGLRSLISHRLRRIGLPLMVGMVTILPLVVFSFIFAYVVADLAGDQPDAIGAADNYEDPNAANQDRAQNTTDADEKDDKDEEDTDEPDLGFAHMWFLWQLLWMVAGFSAVALVVDQVERAVGRAPPAVLPMAISWLLLPASLPFFATFTESVLGPDTDEGFLPDPGVLGFYACFFAFGALRYRTPVPDRVEPIDRLGRAWPLQLVASLVLFAALTTDAVTGQLGDAVKLSDVAEVAMAWLVSFGAIGLFRRFFARPSFRARWFSDGSYWMYLIHLPLVVVAQGVVAAAGLPAIPGFLVIVCSVSVLLVVSYRYLVRYSPIGTLLNGPRDRGADAELRQHLTG